MEIDAKLQFELFRLLAKIYASTKKGTHPHDCAMKMYDLLWQAEPINNSK